MNQDMKGIVLASEWIESERIVLHWQRGELVVHTEYKFPLIAGMSNGKYGIGTDHIKGAKAFLAQCERRGF